jgi:hypothetical protein
MVTDARMRTVQRFRAEQTQFGTKVAGRQSRTIKQEPFTSRERAAGKDDKDIGAKSSRVPGTGGSGGGGDSGKVRASERHKEKDTSRDSRVSPAHASRSHVGRERVASESPPAAGGGGKSSAQDTGGGAEVKRAWRYRKGRWMFVVIKDDVKKDDRKKDAPVRSAEKGRDVESRAPSEAGLSVRDDMASSSNGVDSKGEQVGQCDEGSTEGGGADIQSEEAVKKKARRRPRGRLTLPKKRGKKMADGSIKSGLSNGGKHSDQSSASEGACEVPLEETGYEVGGSGGVGSEVGEGGGSSYRSSLKREPGVDEKDAEESPEDEEAHKGEGGVKPLKELLHRLVRRIHYSAVTSP